MTPANEAFKVYRLALAAGHDQRTAIRAAHLATERIAGEIVVGGFDVWKGIKTPTQIRDEVNRIDGEIRATGNDLAQTELAHHADESGPEITAFMDAVWDPFMRAWTKFWDEHQNWTSNMWGTTWDQAQDYQRQLISIRGKAKDLGLTLRSADPIVPKQSGIEEIVKAIWAMVKVLIIAGVIVGGIIVIGRFV